MVRIVANTGESPENAVTVLDAHSPFEGVAAEYAHLETLYGKQNLDWRLYSQELKEVDGRFYDLITVETGPDEYHDIYFDITGFFGED